MVDKVASFWEWAEKELQDRGLSWYAVERQAGLSNAAISRRARELLAPTYETCMAIARVFDLSDVQVLRRANLLEQVPEGTITSREMMYMFLQLSEEDQDHVMDIVRTFLAKRGRVVIGGEKPASA